MSAQVLDARRCDRAAAGAACQRVAEAARSGRCGAADRHWCCLVRPPLVDRRALHREHRRCLCRRRRHGDRAEGGGLHRRCRGDRQPGGARRRSAGEAGRSRLPRGAGEGGRRGRGAAGDAGESRGEPPAAGGDDRAGAGRADRDRGGDRPQQERRRSLSQPGAGSCRLGAALAAGGCRSSEGARRRCQGAGGAGRRRSASSMSSTRRSSRRWRRWPGRSADRDTAQLNLGYTELRAPIDGIGRQSQCAERGLCDVLARSSSRWCRRTGSGSMPTSRRASSRACGRACR